MSKDAIKYLRKKQSNWISAPDKDNFGICWALSAQWERMQETQERWVWPLEKGMAPHSSILA